MVTFRFARSLTPEVTPEVTRLLTVISGEQSRRELHLESSSLASSHWLGRLANLNAARTAARGIAPHKPLMLLTVIDLIESGDITDGWVKFDIRLVSCFRDYWELVLERQRNQPDITHSLGVSTSRSNLDEKPANQ